MGNTVFFLRDWGPIPPSPVGLRPPGIRMVLAPNLSGLRWYSPICPRQMHGIPPIPVIWRIVKKYAILQMTGIDQYQSSGE